MSSLMIDDPETFLRSYLLGELNEADADQVECRLLADDALFELAQAMEGDLLAACARGALSPDEQRKVLQRLAASPRGRHRLAVAEGLTALAQGATATQALRKAVVLPFLRRPSLTQTPAFRFAAMAAMLCLVMAGGLRLAVLTAHPGSATRNQASAALKLATPPVTSSPATVVKPAILQLATSFVRSGQQKRPSLAIPEGTKSVEIELPLNDAEPYSRYRVTLSATTSATPVWQGELPRSTSAKGAMVVVSLPATLLPQGSYSLESYGLGADGSLEHISTSYFDFHTH